MPVCANIFLLKTLGTKQHKKLVKTLIAYLETARLTQAQLADELGEYQSFLARLENGQRRVDIVEFLILAKILNFNPVHIIDQLVATGTN